MSHLHPIERVEGAHGAATCPRENCPSQDHDVWVEKDDEGYVIASIFECRVCGATSQREWGKG